jgi:hypothetical protein
MLKVSVMERILKHFHVQQSEFALKSNENVEGMAGNYFIRNMLEVMTLQQEAKVPTLHC